MIADLWESLRAVPGQGPGALTRRVYPEAAVDIFVAVRKPTNTSMLILESPTASLPAGFSIPKAGGFRTTIVAREPGPHGRIAIELELVENSGETVFSALVDDVLARLVAADSSRQAMVELSIVLNRWHSFFKTHGVKGLSVSEQKGLFGELLFLREILAPTCSLEVAVPAWTGPSGANQDFEYGGHAYEIKTTSANPLIAVRVSNIRQLDDRCVDSLHLIVVEIECHENADGTLPEAVEMTRAMVRDKAPQLSSDLSDRLLDYGYLDQHASRYASTGYGVRAIRPFSVRADFPRLIEDHVPSGVGDVRYAVAISALGEFEISQSELKEQMEEWLRGLG